MVKKDRGEKNSNTTPERVFNKISSDLEEISARVATIEDGMITRLDWIETRDALRKIEKRLTIVEGKIVKTAKREDLEGMVTEKDLKIVVKKWEKKIDIVEKLLEKKIDLAIGEYAEKAKEERKKYYEKIIDYLDNFAKEVKESEEDRVLLGHRVGEHDEKLEEYEGRMADLERHIPVSV